MEYEEDVMRPLNLRQALGGTRSDNPTAAANIYGQDQKTVPLLDRLRTESVTLSLRLVEVDTLIRIFESSPDIARVLERVKQLGY